MCVGVVCVFYVCKGGLCLLCLSGWLVSSMSVGVACVFNFGEAT